MQKLRLAIFDIDGTIFRSSLVIELVRALVRHKIFPKTADKEVQKEYLAWLDRKGSYTDYINKVVKIYIQHIAGQSSARVYKVARSVIKDQKNRVYRFTRDLIKQLKHRNYFLIAISGSPSYIVEAYARAIGFNKFFGTEMEVSAGKFTGRVLNLDSAFNKKKVLTDFVAAQKIKADWGQSIAVGDTEGDIGILSLVGKSVAFNPNHQLAKIAKRKKWKIMVERKDVIFEITNSKFKISK